MAIVLPTIATAIVVAPLAFKEQHQRVFYYLSLLLITDKKKIAIVRRAISIESRHKMFQYFDYGEYQMHPENCGLKPVLLLHSPFLLSSLGRKRKRVKNHQLSKRI